MAEIYCRKKHRLQDLCGDECRILLSYAVNRLDHCRYGENKRVFAINVRCWLTYRRE